MSFSLPSVQSRFVTVLGAGVLGRRIAATWAAGGHNVNLYDLSEPQLQDAATYFEKNIDVYCRKTALSPGKLLTTVDFQTAVKDAWMVVECVPERIEIKTSTFAQMEQLAPKDALLVTNSSSYRSSEMLGQVSDQAKARICNQHYMMPPVARVVELMTCGHTHPSVFPFLVDQLKRCAMLPYVAHRESSGFIFNRIWAAIKREVLSVISEGVSTPEDIDSIWKNQFSNRVIGPCEMMDQVGLDTVAFIETHYIKERGLSSEKTTDYLEKEFLSKGRLGLKSSKGGFYPPASTTVAKAKPHEPLVYFLDIGLSAPADPMHAGRILTYDPDEKQLRTVLSNQTLPDGLDVFESRLYWTNMGIPSANDGAVLSCKLDGEDVQTVIPSGNIHTPKQLSVDSVNRKIYVCDREGMRVMRCNLDGSNLEVLIKRGDFEDHSHKSDQTNWCVGITVDPASGYFYWTQKGPSKAYKGRIFRAPINASFADPSARTDVELVFENLPEPVDLEISNGFLYWTDRGEIPRGNSINRAELGSLEASATPSPAERKFQIISHNLHEAIGLRIDEKNGHIYATDLGGALYRFDLDGSHKVRLLDEEAAFTGVCLLHA